jgi:ribosomal protein L37AE/L43A
MSEHGCETCRATVLRLVAGNTHTCEECGATWEATERGVYLDGEAP